jgi:hypothetical protein
MSTQPSAYQNICFMLRPYFVQNKYVPHTKNLAPTRGTTTAPRWGGGPHSLRTSGVGTFSSALCWEESLQFLLDRKLRERNLCPYREPNTTFFSPKLLALLNEQTWLIVTIFIAILMSLNIIHVIPMCTKRPVFSV